MLPTLYRLLFSIGLLAVLQSTVFGILVSPEVGSQAQLSTLARNVSGVVTIVDDDTVRVDDFTYDGGASFVYFYLGSVDSDTAFESGLRIGTLLSGNVFDGTQGPIFVDLPIGETLEGYHGFSVWCERAEANFGSGTFLPIMLPEPVAFSLAVCGALGLLRRRRW